MSILISSLMHALREATARSTEQFERTKSSITRTFLKPAAFLIGTEAAIVGVLGAIKLFRLQIGSSVLELVGAGSENILLLTAMVITTYFATLGANMYSGYLARKSDERLLKITHEINKGENFKTLAEEYKSYVALNKPDEARAIATWIINRYPDEAEREPLLVRTIARDMPILHSVQGDEKKLLSAESPRRIAPPE